MEMSLLIFQEMETTAKDLRLTRLLSATYSGIHLPLKIKLHMNK